MKRAWEQGAEAGDPRGGARPRHGRGTALGKHRRQEAACPSGCPKRQRLAAQEAELRVREQALRVYEENLRLREAALAEREKWVLQLQRRAECNGPPQPWLHTIH